MKAQQKIYNIWNYDTSNWDKDEAKKSFFEQYNFYPESEEELKEFIEKTNQSYLEDGQYEVEYYETLYGPKYYIVIANLGLWYGTTDGGKIILGLWQSIQECFEDFNHVYVEGKRLKVDAIHHDGTNHFEIRELTDRGVEYWRKHEHDMGDRELHQRLFNDSHYSHEVSLFKEIYGW